ncbi:MAG: hypothetical protein IT223_12215 [Crocinitomicaceae bacterium]|nr:hypothetical protein [Crocinitomicaceae bacterium]
MDCERVEGFSALYTRFERKMPFAGKSLSTITNYGRHIAAISLHFNCLLTDLDKDQLEDFLFMLHAKKTGHYRKAISSSPSFG